jgi:hypothetical protein
MEETPTETEAPEAYKFTVVGTRGSEGKTHAAEVRRRKVIGGTAPKTVRLCDEKEPPQGQPVALARREPRFVECAKCKVVLRERGLL